MFSEYTYRLGPRRVVHELFFDVNFSPLFAEAKAILAENHRTVGLRKMTLTMSEERPNCIQVANEQRKAELSCERFSPTKYELRSPPLSSVEEELASCENLLAEERKTEIVSTMKTLDSLKLSYKENKFPIRERGEARNSTK